MDGTTRLQRLGNSTGLALRKELLLQAGFRRGDAVRLVAAPGEIRVLAADSPLARCLQLGEVLLARHARVLRALLTQTAGGETVRGKVVSGKVVRGKAVGGKAVRGPAQQPWEGEPAPAPAAAGAEAEGPAAAAAPVAAVLLPPVEALVSLQGGGLARLAEAAGVTPPVGPDRAAVAAALAAAAEPPADLPVPAARLIRQLCGRGPAGGAGDAALAFLAGNLVLELNGRYLDVTEGAAVEAMGRFAAGGGGREDEAVLARWIAANAYPLHRWY